jgi:hypothetical protein
MLVRAACRFAITLVSVSALAALGPPANASAAACPNEQFRTGPSAALPDCRAYELVSPVGLEPDTHDGNEGSPEGYATSLSGEGIAWYSREGAPAGSPSYGPYFLSRRGSGTWSSEDVIPPQSTASGVFCYPSIVYSPDLSEGVLQDGWNWGEGYLIYKDAQAGENCSHDEPPLVQGEPRGAQNVFLRDSATASYQLVNVTPAGVPPRDAWFQDGSADFSHLVFSDPLALTPEAPAPPGAALPPPGGGMVANFAVGEDLYEWANGVVRLVTILPEGQAAWGLLVNGDESGAHVDSAAFTHAVSADGERVFFYAEGEISHESFVGGGNLFLRENAAQPRIEECADPSRACTVQLDAAQGGPESGAGRFQWASADGSKAFFTDERRLTKDSKAEAGKPDLYEYDLARPPSERLVDLMGGASEPASVQGLSGVSDDGSYVYFVAEGDLSGVQENSQGEQAQGGKPNLYLHHGGGTTFIARLDAFKEDPQETDEHGDFCDWDSFTQSGKIENCLSARISPDGAFVAFNSLRELTGYKNVVEATGLRDNEIFLYDATHDTLSCASCDPTKAPPTADPISLEDPRIMAPSHEEEWFRTPGYLTRQLSEDGRVFFTTQNRLVPADENGVRDVYEYQHGQLSLISSGKGPAPSRFRDASPSGNDVFFATTDALVNQDGDNRLSLYDARVAGGFAEPPPPPPACDEGERPCHPPLSESPLSPSPLSASFSGPGNLPPPAPPPPPPHCKKGFARAKVHGKSVCERVHKPHCEKGFARAKVHGKRICERVHKHKKSTHRASRGPHR